MKKITQAQLLKILLATKGAQDIEMVTVTEAQKSKAKDAVKIFKECQTSCTINYIYENSVNNQLEREGKETGFQAKARKNGEHYRGHKAVIYNAKLNRFYLHAKVKFARKKPIYFMNGVQVEKSQVEGLLRVSNSPSTQANLEKKIIARDFMFSSIKRIHMGGKKYEIVK